MVNCHANSLIMTYIQTGNVIVVLLSGIDLIIAHYQFVYMSLLDYWLHCSAVCCYGDTYIDPSDIWIIRISI